MRKIPLANILPLERSQLTVAPSRNESSPFDRDDSGNPPTLKKQKVLTGRVTKARLPAKQSTKRSVKPSDDVPAELGNADLYGVEESAGNNEAYDEEDAVEQIKVEGDDA